jgi:acyl-CoA thioester hydrolase
MFSVRVTVRGYELDINGHVNHVAYYRYGEHARTEHLAAAGCTFAVLTAQGLGPVLLETHVRFLRELRYGDDVDVESEFVFDHPKTFSARAVLRRADGVVSAEIDSRMGVIDHATRRLVADPRGRLGEIATEPEVLG